MRQISSTALSRRAAIQFGIGSAVSAATFSRSVGDDATKIRHIVIEGAKAGRAGRIQINVASGQVSEFTSHSSPDLIDAERNCQLPPGYRSLDRRSNGDLLVTETNSEESNLIVMNGSQQRMTTINSVGEVLEGQFSGDGKTIAVIESDEDGRRLVLVRSNGSGRRVIDEVASPAGMRGPVWSPCGTHLAVVAYDWDQSDGSRGCPAPASHRIEVYSAAGKVTRLEKSDWLDKVEWLAVT